jgi:hypothetical protein
MNLEDRLRETLRRAAAHAQPDAARAYDRFRRRHRRGRLLAVPALTTAASVIVLVAILAAGQLTPGPARPGQPTPSPTPGTVPTPTPQPPPLDYVPGPRTVEVPEAGYAVAVPDGWLVARLGSELRLRPEGEPRAQIEIRTVALRPELGPGKGEAYPATTHFPTTGFHTPLGPYEYSRRPDGRRVLKAGRAATDARYYVAWPYHCPQELPCRVFAKLRTLSVRFYSPPAVWEEVRRVGEGVVRGARPITNALPGGIPAAAREPCVAAVSGGEASAAGSHDTTVRVEFSNDSLVSCAFRADVALRPGNLDTRERLDVRGAGRPVKLAGLWPEGGADPDGHFAVTWRWSNWCGTRRVFAQVLVSGQPSGPGVSIPLSPSACVDRARPSVLEVIRVEQ